MGLLILHILTTGVLVRSTVHPLPFLVAEDTQAPLTSYLPPSDCTTSSTCAEVLFNIDTTSTGITVYGFTVDATQYLVNSGDVNLAPFAENSLFSFFGQIAFFKQE